MRIPLTAFALLTLTACSSQLQTSSGADYLAARPFADPALAEIAAVEPDLHFPARIGIARVLYGSLTAAPEAEAVLWADLASRAQGFGDFIPLSPLVADMVRSERYGRFDLGAAREVGARQHLDYILMIDVSGRGGTVQAAFIDVRSGYPYATAEAPVRERHGFFGGAVNNPARRDAMTLEFAHALLPEIESMLAALGAAQRP